jgi:hypothetical protein
MRDSSAEIANARAKAERRARPMFALICLSCGSELQPTLAEAGSLRCHDCRARERPLRPELAKRQRIAYKLALFGSAA